MSKVWFITGASRGLGAQIAKSALEAGHQVVATGRNAEAVRAAIGGDTDRLLVLPLDVTDEAAAQAAVAQAVERLGRIDVLVNNAGFGQLGVFEQTSDADIRAQFEVNVFGLMNVARAVAPLMRSQRSGRIFNISSVAGLKAVFGSSIYAASKFAVEGFTAGLAEELAPFGVHVTAVAPGFFRTDFLDPSSAKYTSNAIADYEEPLQAFLDFHSERNQNQAGDPAKLGRVLVDLAEREDPPSAFVAGSDAVEWAMTAVGERQAQVEKWRELSTSTDGDWDRDQ